MIKRIIYLIILLLLSLMLVEKIRNNVADRFVYPIVYNIGMKNNNAAILLASGKIKQDIGQYENAKVVYTYVVQHPELMKQKNAEEKAYNYLGNVFYLLADYSNAAKSYYLVLKKDPTNREAFLKFIRINMAYGNVEPIIPLMNSYVARRPTDTTGYTELCAAHGRLGDFITARKNCQMAIKHGRNNARAHYDYAVLLEENNFGPDAEKELQLAKKIQPDIKSRKELEELLFKYKEQLGK